MVTVTALLAQIDAFVSEAGIAETTFGKRAVNDGKFVPRLREGAGITVATMERVVAYIHAQRGQRPAQSRQGEAA